MLEKNSEITVVFTDVQMPGMMDGIALAQYVRKRWPPTIIVVSSGKTEPSPGVLADDIPFVAKPYETSRTLESTAIPPLQARQMSADSVNDPLLASVQPIFPRVLPPRPE